MQIDAWSVRQNSHYYRQKDLWLMYPLRSIIRAIVDETQASSNNQRVFLRVLSLRNKNRAEKLSNPLKKGKTRKWNAAMQQVLSDEFSCCSSLFKGEGRGARGENPEPRTSSKSDPRFSPPIFL